MFLCHACESSLNMFEIHCFSILKCISSSRLQRTKCSLELRTIENPVPLLFHLDPDPFGEKICVWGTLPAQVASHPALWRLPFFVQSMLVAKVQLWDPVWPRSAGRSPPLASLPSLCDIVWLGFGYRMVSMCSCCQGSIGVKRKEQFLRKLFLVICQAATSAGPNASLETGVDATSYKTKCANVANLHLLAGWLRTRMSPSS